MKLFKSLAVVAALAAFAGSAQAQVRITEVSPWSSSAGNSPYAADWFELTNTGSTTVNLAGWSMDDDSAVAGIAPLSGVASLGAGQSAVFIDTAVAGDAAKIASFKATWFGTNVPTNILIGTYTGTGVGLSTGGDQVNVFDNSNTLQAKVIFGAVTNAKGPTLDNAAGLNGVTISTLSIVGTNGAFSAVNDPLEIGSPGSIAAVPEPETYAMLLAGLALIGGIARRRKAA